MIKILIQYKSLTCYTKLKTGGNKMEYVKQIDKYTLATTELLTPESVCYCVDNMTPRKLNCINHSLIYSPTLKSLEFILAIIDHDCNNIEEQKYS